MTFGSNFIVAPATDRIVQVAPSDYMKVLLRYVDVENIPEYLGGGCEAAVVLSLLLLHSALAEGGLLRCCRAFNLAPSQRPPAPRCFCRQE